MVDEGIVFYQFSWNIVFISGFNSVLVVIGNNGGIGIVSNLVVGFYQVIIIDSSLLIVQIVVDIIDVFVGFVLGIIIWDIILICFGFSNGFLVFVFILDGLFIENFGLDYIFIWNIFNGVFDLGNMNYIFGIFVGFYGIMVIDFVGCQEIVLILLGQLLVLCVLDVNIFIIDVSCMGGQDGLIIIMVLGGIISDGNYIFEWSIGLMIQVFIIILSNLNLGQYCVIVMDDNGCMMEECYIVGVIKILFLNFFVIDVFCNGDVMGEIFVSGIIIGVLVDEFYSFVWSVNVLVFNSMVMISEIMGLIVGMYSVIMIDVSMVGCQVIDIFEVS